MRAVVQRVSGAEVSVDGKAVSRIAEGLLVFAAAMQGDTGSDTAYIAGKVSGLRIFKDENGKMNRSVIDAGGEVLLVSQFTLAGDARHGKRPSFSQSLEPKQAEKSLEALKSALEAYGLAVKTGVFGADMAVTLTNDGPVTILLDSERLF